MIDSRDIPDGSGSSGEDLARAVTDAIQALENILNQRPSLTSKQGADAQASIPGDLRSHLASLHAMWDISRSVQPEGGRGKVTAEKWYGRLNDLNSQWDIRSRLEDLDLPEAVRTDIVDHYPTIMQQYLGTSPMERNPGETTSGISFRESLSEGLQRLHEAWNIDDSGSAGTLEKSSTGLKGTVRRLLTRLVRQHTDVPFQRQRDFNAHLVSLMEQIATEFDRREGRYARILLEMNNRQFQFNLCVVKFINTLLQDVLLKRQREFNAEVVQTLQALLIDLPALVLERTEILLARIQADLAAVESMLHRTEDEGDA